MHPRNGLRIAPFMPTLRYQYQLNISCVVNFCRLDRLVAENGGDNVKEFVKRNMKFLFTHELASQFSLSDKETSTRV